MPKDRYESPLASRYASDFMLCLFSPDTRFQTWRRLWVALARAEHNLGLPVTAEQVAELEAHITDIDYETASAREKEVRHDVMAHVYTYGKAAPSAAGIIHLGATSCYVTDNADLIIYREGLRYLRGELLAVVANLSKFAEQYKATPTLGYTHYQPAQLVTVGKRATLWMQDLLSDLEELDFVLDHMKFLGCRGTTGTEASFMELFDGDEEKIDEMNRRIAAEFGFSDCFPVCGQTYPRKVDSRILGCLSGIAQSAYRMANDIRLLQHDRQLEEPFEEEQIGSSAMAYKRNPMRCERICSLSRYLMADAMNAPMTASVQWMERTLDDSANRRISMPEGFLCADAVLRLCQNVTAGLHVNEAIVAHTLREYLPFLSDALSDDPHITTPILAALRKGKSHYVCDERLRQHLQQRPNGKNAVQKKELYSLRDVLDLDETQKLSSFDRERVCVPQFCDCKHPDCRYRRHLTECGQKRYLFQICNQNLWLADCMHRESGLKPILPDACTVIVDEAHKLPETARETVGTDRPSSSAIWLSVIGRRAAGPCSK